MAPFKKLLVANRSEIATRIMRAANELNLRTVAIYAHEDRFSMHRFKADESYQLNRTKGPVGGYLDIEGIVGLAVDKKVDAIHPGYGFLSENAKFAQACKDAGITFVGPDPDLLDLMGDKVAARAAALKAGLPVLPGTEEPVSDSAEALEIARGIGFPLIIKAAFGGGGRGMRVVTEESKLKGLLADAQQEAERAFGNGAVFLERFVARAKHIEVQILGDRHGHIVHLHERDCSVQRRHQKVIEIAPSVALDPALRTALCDAAVKLAEEIGYNNAGTAEFLVDLDADEFFFIEMNPRVQVEHTVTEQVTGIDIVRSQILIAGGEPLHGDAIAIPAQDKIPCNGYAVQARITTEDPENNFTPDFGQIITYRSAAGFGIRLDGGIGTTGATVTPFYDSMLVKVTASGMTFPIALQRMDRALREFRIRGVKTNIPFLENVIRNEAFRTGQATTRLIDTTPELFNLRPKRNRATRLLNFLGDTIVNGNPNSKGFKPAEPFPEAILHPSVHARPAAPVPDGTRQKLLELGAPAFCKDWIKNNPALLLTDTTFRDAHQSLLATRLRTYDMLQVADAVAQHAPQLFSLEMWGGATFDTAMRFLREDPWDRLRSLRQKVPNILFQMLFRGSNAVGYSNYPDSVVAGFVRHAAEAGMDVFRIFDSLNYLPNLQAAMDAVQDTHAICEGTLCYTGNIQDPSKTKYGLQYYLKLAKELERMGAHMLCIKDMAGLCRPFAARALVKALKDEIGIPIHFHTHDTSGINAASILSAAEAGVDVADAAIASLSGGTSQPNLNSIVAALQFSDRETGLDLDALNHFSDFWAHVRTFYQPFDTSEPHGTAEVYLHEMPGGQYTNLKEQAASMGLADQWPAIARTYAEVNDLFGDIIKVTPSSKVVGDMALFLFTRGINPADVTNLPPNTPFPESVIDMLKGNLGQPEGGWPKDLQKVVLGNTEPFTDRPGLHADAVDLDAVRAELATKLTKSPTDDDVFSYLMYPKVFTEYRTFRENFGDVAPLPTPAYYYGLAEDEEITFDIEPGKTLYIRLLNVSKADADGNKRVIFELNGVARHVVVPDNTLAHDHVSRPKADPNNPSHIGSPMPGLIAEVAVQVGQKVEPGDPLLTLEAMKMFTSITAPTAGTIKDLHIAQGETAEAGDLLVTLGE